jgi:NAD(P)-dependent dehydrogenase (short-subunit alcohol dehydrogenase family)
MSLTGKVALVTGAAQGLGFGIATALHEAGAVVALADIREDGLSSAAESLSGTASFVVDLTMWTRCGHCRSGW